MARSVIVSLQLTRLGMTSAVELNPDSRLGAEEVQNVGSDWMLSAKLNTRKTASSKVLPKQRLTIGLIVAKFSSALDRIGAPLTPAR